MNQITRSMVYIATDTSRHRHRHRHTRNDDRKYFIILQKSINRAKKKIKTMASIISALNFPQTYFSASSNTRNVVSARLSYINHLGAVHIAQHRRINRSLESKSIIAGRTDRSKVLLARSRSLLLQQSIYIYIGN